jgi:hypothetical protein
MNTKMTLGAYTFAHNPHSMSDNFEPALIASAVKTWEGVAYFSWPATIVGKKITLNWDLMTTAQFEALQALWVADEPTALVPNGGGGNSFNVMIMNLTGLYFLTLDTGGSFRKNVALEIVILS